MKKGLAAGAEKAVQRDIGMRRVPEIFCERKIGCLGERSEYLADAEGRVFSQQSFHRRFGESRFDPCGQRVLMFLFDLGNQFAGMDRHQRLKLGAVDFTALETGGKLAGCFQYCGRIWSGFVETIGRSFLTDPRTSGRWNSSR